MKKILIVLFALATVLFTVPQVQPAYAATDWGSCVQNNVPSLKCIPVVFGNLVSAALMFVGTVAVFLIVYGGIQLVTSGGDPKKVQGARQIITYSIIGLVIVLSSFAIIYFISYTTGVKCITQFGFNC